MEINRKTPHSSERGHQTGIIKEFIMRLSRSALVLALVLGMFGVLRGVETIAPLSPSEMKKPQVTSLPRLPADLRDALQSRDFAEAIKLIDAAIAAQTPALAANQAAIPVPPVANQGVAATADGAIVVPAKVDGEALKNPPKSVTPIDYLLYLKGRALAEQDAHDSAITTFLKLEKDFPNPRGSPDPGSDKRQSWRKSEIIRRLVRFIRRKPNAFYPRDDVMS
jgi:hypothetical protein